MKSSDYTILATSERFREIAAFWRQRLGALDESTPLASMPTPSSSPRHSIAATLDARAVRALDTLSNDSLGRFTVLTAAIALGVARYFNRSATLLRTPLLVDDAEPALNDKREVPLVFTAPAAQSLRDFVQDAAGIVAESYSFQDYPVDALFEKEGGVDLSSAAGFSLSCAAVHAAPLATLAPVHFNLDGIDAGRFDIDFLCGADLLCGMDFRGGADLHGPREQQFVSGLAQVIVATLGRFDDLSASIRDVERIPHEQRERLLVEWNRTDAPRAFRSAHALFEARAAATPDAVALRAGAGTVSYRQLNERANSVAHHLISDAHDVGAGNATVGIWMDRSPWMVSAVLGALKAGLAYLPIDAECPRERLAFMLRDSGVRRVLIDEAKAAIAATLDCEPVIADRDIDAAATNPSVAVDPSDLAYVIYTSGSTGEPKGCQIEHHSLSNYLTWACDYYWPTPDAGTLGLFTPLSFDLTVPSLFCPLLRGRTLVVYPQNASIEDVLRQQFDPASSIDSINLTPSHIRLLDAQRLRATSIRLAIVGGEALTIEQIAILHRIDPRIRVINEYGPTEATVGCIVKAVAAGEPVVIGRPIANMRAYVLDEEQQPVAIGVRGELCLAGEGLARGYHARPALDAARFLACEFAPGGRVYRTGDIARWLPNGELECFGRVDDQVKIRGYRIEPGEVEAALRRCEGISEALVIPHTDASGTALVAYVVSGAPIAPAALRRTLGHTLPDYMVPTRFVALTDLPLTSNGKVDRARLPSPSSAQQRRAYVAPRTPHEEVVARIWSDVFRLDRVGIDEDFFELGGHSLRALTMMQRIHQELGIDVSIGEILSHPSIAALAKVTESKAPTVAVPILPVPAADHYAVSHGQRRLWLISRIEEESPAYNVSSAFDLRGALDRAALRQAFDALVARHESLRTVFVEVDDQPRQRILPAFSLPSSYVDLREAGDREHRLRTLVAQQAAAPFDLGRGPLLRVMVCQLEESRSTLALTIHHIVSDEWSLRVLITEAIHLYESYRTGVAPRLAPLTIQYRDYAAWQQRMLAGDGINAHRQYWLGQLSGGVPPIELPTDVERPAVHSYRGRHHYAFIDARTRARLRTLGAAHGASPFMTLVAIVKVLLYRYTGQRDIAIGSPIAGRTHADLSNQIGFYVNTLVLRDELRGAEPFDRLLARVKCTAEDAYEYQAFPFDRLVEELDVPRDLSRSPLFDVMVTYESEADAELTGTGVAAEEVRVDSGISKFDLTFAFAESERGIGVEIEYSTDLFEAKRIAWMTSHLLQLVEGVAADAATPIERLPLTGLAEPRASAPVRVKSARPRDAGVVPPRDERELLLVGVLESVLGRTGIGVTDNYFYVGGDSIKAIQIVNRLARQGWMLRVRDLFEAPRIDQLAARLEPATAARRQEPARGDIPLTPIQRWFFLRQPDSRAHFNQSVMLRFTDRPDDESLHELGRTLVEQHDALRMRYQFNAGSITQSYGEPYDPVEIHDLRGVANPKADLERHAAAAQASLDLERGPLARFVLCHLPDGDRLLAVIHHLAVDGVSWRILLDDLRVGLSQLSRGEPLQLGATSNSFQAWSLALEGMAAEVESERAWWDAVEAAAVRQLPYDAAADLSLESDAREQRLVLSADDTEALLSRVHQAYNTRTNDVLFAALARACRDWAGPGAIRLDVEAHGRDGLDLDVSRTVGWFTTLYPIVLDIGDEPDLGRQLTTVKEVLRRTPGHGLGYGLLRGGRPSGAPVLFNFLGQFDTDIDGFEIADETRGPEQGPLARMTHDIEVGGFVAQGRLHMTLRYSSKRFHDRTITRLLDAYQAALQDLIAHCRQRATTERTLSDFRYRDTTTAALVERLGADRVEDVYPLSPMQQGMLYHSVLAGDSPVYLEQFTCSIRGALDVDAFRAAWERVIQRHTVLRTAFFWNHVEQPVQVVFSRVDPPWSSHDWRTLPDAERDARLEKFPGQDLRKGLELDVPPLMRFTLIRLGDESYRFFWTSHHLVLDGWSTAIVLSDVFACYQASVAGQDYSPAATRPFGEYIDWLQARDPAQADAYWRAELQGFSRPTPLPASATGHTEPRGFAVAELSLPADASTRLASAVRDHHLTLNTLARGAWALVLGAHAGQDEVLYGATVAGRPASLPDVDTIVGLFINTVPIRVRIDSHAPLVEWLHRMQVDQAALDQYAYSSLADIQQFSDVPRRTPLFESILVFENYPVDQSLDPGLTNLAIDGIEVREQTNYPLTLAVVPGEQVLLRLSYDTSRYDEAAAHSLLREVQARFDAFVADPHQAVRAALTLGEATDDVPRHRFALDTASPEWLRAIVRVLYFRYSANEDLRVALDSTLLSRDGLQGSETFDAVLRQSPAHQPAGKTDLAFAVAHDTDRVVIEARSDTGRFDLAFLQRIPGHLATLAAAVAANPQESIARLPLCPEAERARLLEDFNRTDKDWGPERTIAQYFEDQASACPDRIAVRVPAIGRDDMDQDATWTYAELNARANQLARRLASRYGVGPDVRIGVLAERSFEMVLALMAIEKAGGAYVPLDPEYPRELLQFMMEDSGAAVILTQQKFHELVADYTGPVIHLDTDWALVLTETDENLPSRVTGDSLAYVIYTSGSTGRPKGAMNTHRGIANRLLWMQEAYGLTEHDRVLQKTPFSFDVSVWEFFWPLMVGAQLVVAKPGGHRDAAYLVALIELARVSTLHFVPSMLQAFIEEPDLNRCASLKRVIASGEAITPELLRRYSSRLSTPLHNLYGPTEAAVDVTAWACNLDEGQSMVPIGTPIANIRLYILDELLQPVPEGVTGELFLAGVGVGRGYLNRPDLTAAKFIPDLFSGDPAARMYRTGDLSRYRHDGVVDFLGRIDHQVKLRGFRIELGEIESALLPHASIRECVVVVREDQPGMKRLVAYVVLKPEHDAVGAFTARDDLRAHLQRTLPDYMVPGVIVPLADLPRLTNGKLDRKSLPLPEDVIVVTARRRVAPRDPVERRLVRVWEDVLGQKAIGVTDDFFDLGGHSILAVKLVSAIQTEFGRNLPLAQLLAHQTIERLAVALRSDDDTQHWRPLVEIKRGASGPPLFLLPGAGGNVIYFHTLAQHLTTPRPIYGLQAVGLDGRTAPLTTVEAIAAVNIEEMRRVWPSGPYYLAGHSFGGRVALEMAQQLLQQGQSVALLAVLDTPAPTFDPIAAGADWQDAHWLAKIAREIEEFFGIEIGVTLEELLPLPLDDQLMLVVERMQRAGAWAPGADRSQLGGYLQVYRANSQAAYIRYETYARVPMALFKALESDPDLEATPVSLTALTTQHAWGWDGFAHGEVGVFEVPGAHLSMLTEPHVAELARALDEALAGSSV